MIKVSLKSEPSDFDHKIRQKGTQFLYQNNISPGTVVPKNFKWLKLWTEALEDAFDDYGAICSYSCFRMELSTDAVTIDHYRPKKYYPEVAYEWNNFRLCAFRINSKKKNFEDVLDPFQVQDGWFQIELITGKVFPAHNLEEQIQQQIINTISRLKLNAKRLKNRRIRDFSRCSENRISPEVLQEDSPFVYKEMVRQGFI